MVCQTLVTVVISTGKKHDWMMTFLHRTGIGQVKIWISFITAHETETSSLSKF